MKKIKFTNQALTFLKNLAPEPKKDAKSALRLLLKDQGDIKGLDNDLAGYYRLKINNIRIIFYYDNNVVMCMFAERRNIVYEIFKQILKDKLTGDK